MFLRPVCVLCIVLIVNVDGKCSRLPSGKCWVNCMQVIFDIICTNVTAEEIQNDIRVFSGTTQQFRLFIWSSSGIGRLSADVFRSVANQITVLDLQDVDQLNTFPELNQLSSLRRFSVWNSPKLCNLALELLPVTIWKIALSKVCISNFENDFFEVASLPDVEVFVLRNVTIKGWAPEFLNVFPNITDLEICNSTIDVPPSSADFATLHKLKSFNVVQNVINSSRASATNTNDEFLMKLVKSVSLTQNGIFDMYDNNYTIGDPFLKVIQKLIGVASMNLRGNPISASNQALKGLFDEFSFLTYLNLGRTNLRPVTGLLAGLPKLQTLILDGNELSELDDIDIFDGFYGTNLSYLDLSRNNMVDLPIQESVRDAVRNLTELNLRGNRLRLFLQKQGTAKSREVVSWYANLKTLDLGDNNLTHVYGGHLKEMVNLQKLNLSCNPLKNISHETFEGMPTSLKDLDLSICIHTPSIPTWIDDNAFMTLPASLHTLRLNTGTYKKWIFALFNFSAETSMNLQEIHLEDNEISYIDKKTMVNLPNLQVLNLRKNKLQSIGPQTFAGVPALKKLYLNDNRMISVGLSTFSGEKGSQLQALEVLDLSDNDITEITPGSFDELPNLKALFLGGNPAEVQGVFVDEMESPRTLEYFGMQGYNKSCLDADFFTQLPKLKWIFRDDYNLIRVDPDKSLFEVDDFLLSIVKECNYGEVKNENVLYRGLPDYISVSVHDSDDLKSPVQYPIIGAFLPL